jgi:hypothetical protein
LTVAKEEEDENYRPYDTLKAIGFTKDEAKGFLTNIETAASTQLPPEPKKAPEIELKYRTQKKAMRRSQLKNILLIVWGYAFAVWIYVISVQFLHPDWIYSPFATWLPIRMDYVGEAAFVSSFIIITSVTMWNTKRSMRPKFREQEPNSHPKSADSGT